MPSMCLTGSFAGFCYISLHGSHVLDCLTLYPNTVDFQMDRLPASDFHIVRRSNYAWIIERLFIHMYAIFPFQLHDVHLP